MSAFNEDPSTGAAPAGQTPDRTKQTLVVETLLHGSRQCVSIVNDIGARHGLNVDDWLIINALSGSDGLSMSQIAAHALSSGATLTRAVDKLVSRSLVFREVGHTDRRQVLVFLSPLGDTRHAAMMADIADAEEDVRARLTAAGLDPDALARVLSEIWQPHQGV